MFHLPEIRYSTVKHRKQEPEEWNIYPLTFSWFVIRIDLCVYIYHWLISVDGQRLAGEPFHSVIGSPTPATIKASHGSPHLRSSRALHFDRPLKNCCSMEPGFHQLKRWLRWRDAIFDKKLNRLYATLWWYSVDPNRQLNTRKRCPKLRRREHTRWTSNKSSRAKPKPTIPWQAEVDVNDVDDMPEST